MVMGTEPTKRCHSLSISVNTVLSRIVNEGPKSIFLRGSSNLNLPKF